MKQIKAVALLIILSLAITLCSCELLNLECTVTFCDASGEYDLTVVSGMPINYEEQTPDGYKFLGWYSDEDFEHPVDISKGVTKSTVLYARYEADYDEFSKNISEISTAFLSVECIKSTKVESSGNVHAVSTATGSGVIVKAVGGYYYFVTNHHVIASELGYTNEYKAYDVYGKEYKAELVASSATSDLALLRIEKGKSELVCLEINTDIPGKEEAVASIGNPMGKRNTLTFGKIKNYKEVEISDSDEDMVDVDFKLLWHTAYLKSGSSGGALINADMQIVGINFATGASSDGKFAYGFAIPAQRLADFLDNCLDGINNGIFQ